MRVLQGGGAPDAGLPRRDRGSGERGRWSGLGLFSSTRAAKQATEALRDKLDYPILCQGDDSTGLLVKKFSEVERACLFGTLSLWQGVDVPGSSPQLVIMDRIPFPRPDDPLASARQKAITPVEATAS